MKRSAFFSLAVSLVLPLLAVSAAQAGPVRCSWADSKDSNHPAISGVPVALRGTVQSASTNLTYTWNFGDGSAVESGPVTNPYVIETTHTYSDRTGKVFTATLTVKDGAATVGSDTYKVVISADDRTTRKKIALEKGLWYLHSKIIRDTAPASSGGQIRGRVGNWGVWDLTLNSMVTGTAMAEAGFKATGNVENPYTEDLQRLVNFVTEQLAITPIGLKGDGSAQFPYLNPEARTSGGVIDGYGVYFKETSDREYEYGAALRFLANAGYTTQKPLAFNNSLNYTGNPSLSIGNWTYAQIVQQMIDFFSWVQLYDRGIDYGSVPISRSERPVPANKRGGWPYWGDGWRTDSSGADLYGAYGDTAMAYWIVTGLKPAQQMGCSWPAFVKTELNTFLLNNQDLVTSSPYYGEFHFGEGFGQHLVERAGQGMVLLNWAGVNKSHARVTAAKNYVGKFWNKDNFELNQSWNTNARGFLGCTNPDGSADDCFQHWQLDAFDYSYWEPVQGTCCDEYPCAQTGCWYYETCTATDPWGNCIDGTCYPWAVYCTEWDRSTCLAPNGFYACNASWVEVTESTKDALNIFGFLCVTEGMQANGVTSGFPSADPYNLKYVDLLVNNQYENGSWHDRGWVFDSPFGTSWAVMALAKL